MFRFVIAALVVGMLAGCAGAAAPTPIPTANPTAAPTASPTPSPTASPVELPVEGDLEAGTYTGVYEGHRFTFNVPASGWATIAETGCCVMFQGEDEVGAIIFLGGDFTSLYEDACESQGSEFEPGPSVDDLASALSSLAGFESSGPTDVTVNRWEGKRVALTVPADVDVRSPDCDQARYSLSSGRWYQAASQTDDMWILDVDGQRQVLTFSTAPNTPAHVVEQLEQIRDSIVIERI